MSKRGRPRLEEETTQVSIFLSDRQIKELDDFIRKHGDILERLFPNDLKRKHRQTRTRSYIIRMLIDQFLNRQYEAHIYEQTSGDKKTYIVTSKRLPTILEGRLPLHKIGIFPDNQPKFLGTLDLKEYGVTVSDLRNWIRSGLLPNECLKHMLEHQQRRLSIRIPKKEVEA